MTRWVLAVLVIAGTIAAWRDWRRGLYALIAIALVVDPLRKMAPGAPAYMMLATVPVWVCTLIGAWRAGELSFRDIQETFPALLRLVILYLLALALPVVLSLTYAPGSWRYTVLGAYMQVCLLGGILLGFVFPRRIGDIERLMKWYCLLASVMMIGAPLEQWNIEGPEGLIGTKSLGAFWVTYRMGDALRMVSGFFRSPDIQGWHAAGLVMFGVTLALRSTRWGRVGWAALAGWGCVALIFCARRKMVSMVPVFGIGLFVLYTLQGHVRRLARVMLAVGMMVSVGGYFYLSVGANEDVERFYSTTMVDLDESIQSHGIESVGATVQQAGFFGYGLGMAGQGIHHIGTSRPRVWQESGPSMIAAELGVPGVVAACLLVAGVLLAGYKALLCSASSCEQAVYVGLAAVVLANMAAGVVSSQVFGDPFIGCFVPFLIGTVLSGARLQAVENTDTLEEDSPPCVAEKTV